MKYSEMLSNCCGPGVRETFSAWTLRDRLGRIAVRLGLKRYSYTVQAGLYRIGSPGGLSDVFVTANYKLSFDLLRRALVGMNAYILVLDTKGINVWCAAGKGTFGTGELLRQLERVDLQSLISHRKLILPQLGAPGISASSVKRKSGFSVEYGPVRAGDIPEYLRLRKKNETVPDKMRQVGFSFSERFELVPLEFNAGLKYFLPVFAALLVPGIFGLLPALSARFTMDAFLLLTAYGAGTIGVPLLFPVLPGKAFALKGLWTGLIFCFITALALKVPWNHFATVLPVLAAVSAYTAMNFTGASPITNLTGVEREMKRSIPLIAASAAAGLVLTGLNYGGLL